MTSQTTRLLTYLRARPWQVIPLPQLVSAAAGENGLYVTSISKRLSECRSAIQCQGGDLVLAYDRRVGNQRQTGYRYVPPKQVVPAIKASAKCNGSTVEPAPIL